MLAMTDHDFSGIKIGEWVMLNMRVLEEAVVAGTTDEVWSLVTEPRHFQVWYAFGGAEIDLRPGGLITMRWEEHGTFEALVENVFHSKLFSFRWKLEPNSVVEITLESVSTDKTRVRIEEYGEIDNPDQSALAWRNGLGLLVKLSQNNESI